jgi:guanine deaminase
MADPTSGGPVHAFRGTILDFTGDPRATPGAMRHIEDGMLLVRDGRVLRIGEASEEAGRLPPGSTLIDYSGRLILPGFVDAHVHYPQTGVIASHGKQLLDWLEDYTFPEEARFADAAYATGAAEFFLDELVANGTTSAAVFPSVHKQSVDRFFEAAARRNMRMLCGKVMMDRNCPAFLRDDAKASYEDSAELIERWHRRGRMTYAVTPRFAATSTEAQLGFAGRLMDEYDALCMQTHVAENQDEVRWIAELYPWSRSYLDVYDHFGLLREGALFAHCIHLDTADWARMAAAGSAAVHCPTSNLFLGSGLFDLSRARDAGAAVALATDVGGGTSFSMLRTMHEAYKVAQMGGHPLDAADCFYLATLAGAKAIGEAEQIGNFDAGKEADFVVLRLDATPLMARRIAGSGSIDDKLFALLMLGDERAVEATYVMGNISARQAVAG